MSPKVAGPTHFNHILANLQTKWHGGCSSLWCWLPVWWRPRQTESCGYLPVNSRCCNESEMTGFPPPPSPNAILFKQMKMADSSPRLPPETASYGGGMSNWEKDDAGGGVGAGSSMDRSSWTPYQLGQTDVCFRGERNKMFITNHPTCREQKTFLPL